MKSPKKKAKADKPQTLEETKSAKGQIEELGFKARDLLRRLEHSTEPTTALDAESKDLLAAMEK